MPFFRSILVAADFSDRSKAAFRVACAIADETKTRMFVLHVIEPNEVVQPATEGGVPGEEAPSPEQSALTRLRDEYAPGDPIDVEYLVRRGAPAETVLTVADETGAEAIVLGTHGRTGLRRLLTGSVAESVLRLARRPVLALGASESPVVGGEPDVILHPTDLTEKSDAACRAARALARDLGARLVLLHVLPVEVVPYGTVPVALDVAAVRDTLEALGRSLDGPDMKHPIETRLAEGEAVPIILQAAQEYRSRAIVMGTHARTGLSRLLLGSVAEGVLRKAPCPVLIAKNPESASTSVPASHTHVIVV